jgi:hypothetical protein
MKEQNLKNHARYVPGYHFVASTALLAILIGSFINLFHSSEENIYSASLITAITIVLVLVWFYARGFALKAQDRAIRSEENLRCFIATGHPLDPRLTMGQIIALRFAGDDEFVALVKRAADENLSASDIKKAIQHWRPDNYRA